MKSKNISKEKRREVISKIKSNIAKYKTKVDNKKIKELKAQFLDLFLICESSYKVLLKTYLQDKGEYTKDKDMKLYYKQIEAALNYGLFDVDSELLNKMFSTTDIYRKKGSRSAKVLRDSLSHSLNMSAIDEIVNRKKELFKDMNSFIRILSK